jgi:hypothetical protein
MTSCEDITFEHLVVHVEDRDDDSAVGRHVFRCAHCAMRVDALRMQSLGLTMLTRRQRARATVDYRSAQRGHPGVRSADGDRDGVAHSLSSEWLTRGPGACLGAARDAGLSRYHLALRELFLACLTNATQASTLVADADRTAVGDPGSPGPIVAELRSLAHRLSGLGLSLEATLEATTDADDLSNRWPGRQRLKAVATPLLDGIIALEGHSRWVVRARNALALACTHTD